MERDALSRRGVVKGVAARMGVGISGTIKAVGGVPGPILARTANGLRQLSPPP